MGSLFHCRATANTPIRDGDHRSDGAALPKSAEEGIEVLRDATLRLGDQRHGEIKLTENRPGSRWLPRPA